MVYFKREINILYYLYVLQYIFLRKKTFNMQFV